MLVKLFKCCFENDDPLSPSILSTPGPNVKKGIMAVVTSETKSFCLTQNSAPLLIYGSSNQGMLN